MFLESIFEYGLKNIQDSNQFVMKRKFTLLLFYILGTVYCAAQEYTNYLCPMPENGKYYYVNIFEERVTEAIYDEKTFSDDLILAPYTVVTKNGRRGVIDTQGRETVPCEYDNISALRINCKEDPASLPEYVYHNLVICKRGEAYGIIDAVSGRIIIPFVYDGISGFMTYDGIILCKKKGKWGGVDIRTGEQIIPFDYDELDTRDSQMPYKLIECYNKRTGRGYIDTKGNVIIPLVHYSIYRPYQNDGYVVLKNRYDDLWYCYNMKGRKIKIGRYNDDDICPAGEKRIAVKQNEKWGLINCENGNWVVPCIYNDIAVYCNGITEVEQNNGIALMSKDGNLLTDFILQHTSFRLGYDFFSATNRITGKEGIFNYQGEIIIPFEYDDIHPFNKEDIYIKFNKNGKWGLMDRNNNTVIPAMYDDIRLPFDGKDCMNLIGAKKSEKWGFINSSNQQVAPFIYSSVELSHGVGNAYNDGKCYCIDHHGNILWEGEHWTELGKLKWYQYLSSLEPSDVDKDIPLGNIESRNTYVVIIANEKYTEQGVSQVQFAQNDGKIFKDYCMRTLGVPLKNIKFIENATINQMRSSINWVCDMTNALDNEANVILYYSGHGVPDEKTGNAYLLPSDGIANDYRSAYSLDELYSQFGKLPTKKTMLFLDACFSGTTKEGKMMLADSRGVAIKSKSTQPKGNMIVLSAAQGDETAFPYKKKKHGMFTYFLLKKLQETKGDVSLGELSSYINKNVSRNSVMEMGKKQTPSVSASVSFQNSDWKNLKLK